MFKMILSIVALSYLVIRSLPVCHVEGSFPENKLHVLVDTKLLDSSRFNENTFKF